MAVAITYIGQNPDTSGNGNHGTVPIGTAADDRIVVVCVGIGNSLSTTINGATLNGTPMDLVVGSGSSGGSRPANTAIFSLPVPTGTTATLSVSLSENVFSCVADIFTITGAAYEAHDTDANASSSATSRSSSVDVPAGGGAIFTMTKDDTAGISWSGATVRSDANFDSDKYSSADFISELAVTPHTATVSWSGANECAISGASWGPAMAGAARKMMHYRRLRV